MKPGGQTFLSVQADKNTRPPNTRAAWKHDELVMFVVQSMPHRRGEIKAVFEQLWDVRLFDILPTPQRRGIPGITPWSFLLHRGVPERTWSGQVLPPLHRQARLAQPLTH